MSSGKKGEGQLVMAMVACFISGGGRAVHGLTLSPIEVGLINPRCTCAGLW